MIIDVLGCGLGIEDYKFQDPGQISIGVNDIKKWHKPTHLVVVDRPDRFNAARFSDIISTQPCHVWTPLEQWGIHFRDITYFNLSEKPADLSVIKKPGYIPHHVDSTYTAVCLAAKLLFPRSARERRIHVYGVHIYGHPSLEEYKPQIVKVYSKLYKYLLSEGIQLFCQYDTNMLAESMPFLHHYSCKPQYK